MCVSKVVEWEVMGERGSEVVGEWVGGMGGERGGGVGGGEIEHLATHENPFKFLLL